VETLDFFGGCENWECCVVGLISPWGSPYLPIGKLTSRMEKQVSFRPKWSRDPPRRRPDHAAEKSSALSSTCCLTTMHTRHSGQEHLISITVRWKCIVRRKISPLRLWIFAAAPTEPCKYPKTPVEMTRDLAYWSNPEKHKSLSLPLKSCAS
jgi:hypothetical protein